MQNLSRLHRGFIKACKNYWFCICKTYRDFIEASSRLANTIGLSHAKPIEASSRLHRGLQRLLVLHMQTLSRLHRGLQKLSIFHMQNLSRLQRGFIEAKQSKKQPQPHWVSEAEVALWFCNPHTHLNLCKQAVTWERGPDSNSTAVWVQSHWLPIEASLRLSLEYYKARIPEASMLLKTIGFSYAKPIEASSRLHRGL